jgi:hypothetical protein
MNDVIVMKVFGIVMICVLFMASILAVNAPHEQDLQLQHHCEMVEIYRATNGQYGWPDYNNTAHLCAQEK